MIKHCTCPSISSPDDMIIALCLQRIGIDAIHSSRFHQARPNDYALEVLLDSEPISFHKFWQIDPFEVYEEWLSGDRSRNKYLANARDSHCPENDNLADECCNNQKTNPLAYPNEVYCDVDGRIRKENESIKISSNSKQNNL